MRIYHNPTIAGAATGSARDGFINWLAALSLGILLGTWGMDARGDFDVIYQTPDNAFTYLTAEQVKWPSNHINFLINPNGQNSDVLRHTVEAAFLRWSKRAAITYSFSGFTTRKTTGGNSLPPVPGTVLIEAISLDEMRDKYGDYAGYAQLWWDGNITGAEIALVDTCEGVIVHEIGHILNLGHSSGDSVMRPANGCKSNLTMDDIQAINTLYPASANYEASLGAQCGLNKYMIHIPRLRYEEYDVAIDACVSTSDIAVYEH